MEFGRPSRGQMCFTLLILGPFSAVVALSGPSLDCTNDFEEYMSCDFYAQECSEYNLTLLSNDGYGEKRCLPKLCDSGRCCCSVETLLILGESHTATVWKGDQRIESKYISVADSVKPKPPTIISVDQINKSFRVKWKTNTNKGSVLSMTSNVAYNRKGHTDKRNLSVTPTVIDGENIYEIPGRDLEPSTTYVVSVRNYVDMSGMFSDSSNEWEFTTPASSSSYALLLAIIVSLSVAAVLISGAIFSCYVKLKTTLWDTVAKCSNPNILIINPKSQELLKPEDHIFSKVCVEPLIPEDSKPWSKGSLTDTSSESYQQSSGISTGSSCLSYANAEPDVKACVQDALLKAFPNISPVSASANPVESKQDSGSFSVPYNQLDAGGNDTSSGSSCFDNRTYSILMPSCLPEIPPPGSEGGRAQAGMACDSAYHPCEGDAAVSRPDQQAAACPLPLMAPPAGSPPLPTDMSYQQCGADAGRYFGSEESSLASVSSGTNASTSLDPVSGAGAGRGPAELSGEMAEAVVCDDNPCYGCVPAGSHRFPPVEDDYQSFQNLVGQPEFLLSGETEEREGTPVKCPAEPYPNMCPVIPGSTKHVQRGPCFLSLIPAHQATPVITESGYQSV